MTPNPWERLREAVSRVVQMPKDHRSIHSGEMLLKWEAMIEALADLPATPPQQPVTDAKVADLLAENAKLRAEIGALESRVPDEERERAIELWIHRIAAARFNNDTVAFDKAVQDGCDLMRSAPAPQPVTEEQPDDLGIMRDAKGLSERCRELRDRLVSLAQPVPDAERERAIKEWRKEITAYARALLRDEQIPGRGGDKLIDEAVALMRSSAPQPVQDNRYRNLILWALGEVGDFPPKKDGDAIYYWRRELRRKLNEIDNEQPVPAPLTFNGVPVVTDGALDHNWPPQPVPAAQPVQDNESEHMAKEAAWNDVPVAQPVKSSGVPCGNAACGYWTNGIICTRCGLVPAQPAEKPAPASDWRERFDRWVKAGSLWDTIEAMHDGLAALEAEVARAKEKQP